MKNKSFRVRYGFGALDFEIVEEAELEKAIYAQVKGVAVHIGNSFINGRNIISITPNYHAHTGWHPTYEPNDGEDWKQITRDCPAYEGVIELFKTRVAHLIGTGQEKMIGKNIPLPELEVGIDKLPESMPEAKQLAEKMRVKDEK